jgi:aminoglycoside 6-adenylyltransferase
VDFEETLARLVEWAEGDENVRAVIMTGSGARGPMARDEWSDIDLELYVKHPELLLQTHDWYEQFGEVLVVEALPNPGWHPTRLIYYVDGKIDFMIGPVAALETAQYDGPCIVLIDKDDPATMPELIAPEHRVPPDADAFIECTNWFYAAALMSAKSAVRQELLMAKQRDIDLKAQLLRMIEWDHQLRYGRDLDTWYLGRQRQEWMDEDIQAELATCWAHLDARDSARALTDSMALFGRLAERTAERLGLPPFHHVKVQDEVHRILARLGD